MMDKIKVAIPVFGSYVSPRCDCAPEMLFLELADGEVVSQIKVPLEGINPLQRIREVCASGASLLVCGALPCFYRRMIDAMGIRIVHAQGMTVDDLIKHMKHDASISTVSHGQGSRWKHQRPGCRRVASTFITAKPGFPYKQKR